MSNYNRVNLDGINEGVSGVSAVELTPSQFLDADFGLAADNDAARFIADINHLSTNITDVIPVGEGVNAQYLNANRRFAGLLAAAQTVTYQAELGVNNGLLEVVAAGAGICFAQEALTTGAGETARIHVRMK